MEWGSAPAKLKMMTCELGGNEAVVPPVCARDRAWPVRSVASTGGAPGLCPLSHDEIEQIIH